MVDRYAYLMMLILTWVYRSVISVQKKTSQF